MIGCGVITGVLMVAAQTGDGATVEFDGHEGTWGYFQYPYATTQMLESWNYDMTHGHLFINLQENRWMKITVKNNDTYHLNETGGVAPIVTALCQNAQDDQG